MHRHIVQHRDKLDRLFGHADELQKNAEIDSEVVSHFTAYLCVKTSGYVESSLRTILLDYVDSTISEQRLVNFVESRLTRTLNPRKRAILDLAGEFDQDWKNGLDLSIGNDLARSLSEIAKMRNDISHGRDVDLSLKDLKYHFENAKRVVEVIDEQCLTSKSSPSLSTITD